ncbi:MAG TPA: hypothetical protein VL119_12215, partial [Acidimicrobiia bacterium]|nr:hypothetical protein [Acidimicrobiia bacterium]
YAIESNEGAAITVVPAAQASFSDTVTLLDRAACTPVATPGRFEYRFTSSDPDVVAVTAMPCPPGLPADYCPFHTYFDLTAKTPGAARVHVVAIDVRTAATVAQTDVRVTAKR